MSCICRLFRTFCSTSQLLTGCRDAAHLHAGPHVCRRTCARCASVAWQSMQTMHHVSSVPSFCWLNGRMCACRNILWISLTAIRRRTTTSSITTYAHVDGISALALHAGRHVQSTSLTRWLSSTQCVSAQCNNFSDEFATFLTGSGIPPHITNLPAEVLHSLQFVCTLLMTMFAAGQPCSLIC